MKHWKPILLVLWLVSIVLALKFYIIPQEEALNTVKIEQLKQENKILKQQNQSLDKDITILKTKADSLKVELKLNEASIIKLKQQHNENIHRITAMSRDELYGYFARFNANSTTNRP